MILEEYLKTERPLLLRIGTKGTGAFIYIGTYKKNLLRRMDMDTRHYLREKIKEAAEDLTRNNGLAILKKRIWDYEDWKPCGEREVLDVSWSTIDDACIIIIEGCEAIREYEPPTSIEICPDINIIEFLDQIYIPAGKELKQAYLQMKDERLPDDKRKKAAERAAQIETLFLNDAWGYFQGNGAGVIREIKRNTLGGEA